MQNSVCILPVFFPFIFIENGSIRAYLESRIWVSAIFANCEVHLVKMKKDTVSVYLLFPDLSGVSIKRRSSRLFIRTLELWFLPTDFLVRLKTFIFNSSF